MQDHKGSVFLFGTGHAFNSFKHLSHYRAPPVFARALTGVHHWSGPVVELNVFYADGAIGSYRFDNMANAMDTVSTTKRWKLRQLTHIEGERVCFWVTF